LKIWQWCVCSVGIAAALSACAAGPDFRQPASPSTSRLTPQALGAIAAADGAQQKYVQGLDISGQWWTLFRSKALKNLVERAIRDNPDLKAGQAALAVAVANAGAQRGGLFPLVTGDYSGSRQKSPPANSANTDRNSAYTVHTAQVSISYAPDVFGLNRRQVESIEAQAETENFHLEATFLTLTSNLVLSAIKEASLREQIEATNTIIRLQKETLGLLKEQLGAGQVTLADVATQEAALAQVEQTLPSLEKRLFAERNLMVAMSGHFAGEGLPERFRLRDLHLPKDLPVSLPSQVVRQRPDVRAAEANLHAATAQVGVAIANRLPQFNLTANAGTTGAVLSKLASLSSPASAFWALAASGPQVLFDGFSRAQRQRAAEAGLDEAAAQYRSTVIGAFRNVADALQAIEADARVLRAAKQGEAAAKKSVEVARDQFRLVDTNTLQLFNAQQSYHQALLAVAEARANRYADTVALFQALGGGWWNRTQAGD
jgi:NodT family efflux transporter outer membrane factor (OMF) lipoprotein